MMHDDLRVGDTAALQAVRRFLLAILLIGFIGTLTELFLLEHDEDAWQLIPIALLSAGIIAVPGRPSRQARWRGECSGG